MKTKSALIIEALKTGKDLSLSEIADHLSEATGQQIKLTDFSSVLSKLSKPDKTEIGYFIQRRKKPKSPYRYKLVDEALEMTTEELIDLSRNVGKNRFTIEQAVEKYPGIKKYRKRSMVKTPEEVDPPDKADADLVQKGDFVQNETPIDNDPGEFEMALNEAIGTILSSGITINVNVNIRFAEANL